MQALKCKRWLFNSPRAHAIFQAEALFIEDSLIVANLQSVQARQLCLFKKGGRVADKEAACRQAWALLSPVTALLLRRLSKNTLLPGTCRKEEVAFATLLLKSSHKAQNTPQTPSLAALDERRSACYGYACLLSVAVDSLMLLTAPVWSLTERRVVQSFVLSALDVIPRTADNDFFYWTRESACAACGHTIRPISFRCTLLRSRIPCICFVEVEESCSDPCASVTECVDCWNREEPCDHRRIPRSAARRHRQARLSGVRFFFVRQGGALRQRVCFLLRLSLRVVLQRRAPGAGLGRAQKGMFNAGCGAKGGDG